MPIDSIKWAGGTPANPRGRKLDFVDWIRSDLIYAKGVHDTLVAQWIRWLEQYRAPVNQPLRNTPYEGAANYVLPMTATDSDQLYAKFIQTIHASDNLWTLSDLNERWTPTKKPMQDFLTWLDASILHMYDVDKRVFNEMVKLGTGIYKTGWLYERRPVYAYNNEGRAEKVMRVRGQPFVDHVRLPDFVFPPNSLSLQPDEQGGAPWVAERLRPSIERLKWMARAAEPYLPNVSKEDLDFIIRFEEQQQTDYDAAIQKAEYDKAISVGVDFETDDKPATTSGNLGSPSGRVLREIELWEVHARFPTQSWDSQDDIIVWFHEPTQKIVRGVYQYYHHMRREYEVVRYFPSDGFYGIGVCEQKEVFQQMQSDLFNFNWDNAILANCRMIIAKSGTNIAPGEPFYPWKVIVTDDDVNKSVGVFPMADIYPSLPALQSQVQAMGERRTGISDIQLGNLQQLPGRTPATTMLSLLQEGNRRPDLTIKDMRYSGLSAVGLRVLQVCQQMMGSGTVDVGGQTLLQLAVQMLGTPEGVLVGQKLTTPLENIEFGLGVAITATSGSANKEVERQNYLSLLQLGAQLAPQFIQLMQLAMQAQGTPLGAVAMQSAQGLQELYRRLLEQYDIRNPEAILPLENAASAGGAAGIPAPGGGPFPGPTGIPGAAGPGVPAGAIPGPGGVPAAPALNPALAVLFGGIGSGL